MVETLHPDVFTQETNGQPSIVGVSTSTVGFVGTARMGPIDELTLITGFTEFVAAFGKAYPDSFLEDAVYAFFNNGGARCFISRVVGSGNAVATVNLPALAGAAAAALLDGTNAAPFVLAPADTLEISVDGGGSQVFTFNATRAALVAAGAAVPTPTNLDTIVVVVDGGVLQVVTFDGTESSSALIAQAINTQTVGMACIDVAGTLTIQSDVLGTDSDILIDASSSVSGLAASGFTSAQTAAGTGNVANILTVSIAEVLAIMAGLTDATASSNGGAIRITHDTPGLAGTLEATAAAAPLGMPAGEVAGSNAAPIDMIQIDTQNPGAWGNTVSITTERWRATTTEDLLTSGTEVAITDVSFAEIGDVVLIDDGTTSVVVHVRSVDIPNKRIQFNAVTLGSTINLGAVTNTASSHPSRTTFSAVGLTTDTVISVVSSSQMRVGTELSLDNGTAVIFREVLLVNGNDVTLNAALGIAFAVDDPVALQTFNLKVLINGEVAENAHNFLSLDEDNLANFVEFRLDGTGNQSGFVEAADLAPVIGTDLLNRPAPVVGVLLTGGNDGAVPLDNDYIGSVDPASGLQLFEDRIDGEINILAIPGITTLAVQHALSDFATRKLNQISLIDPPLSNDQPLEVRDWRLNQFNRDTSYAALYYPWLIINDRNSAVNANKNVPPSGHIAGLYARVDAQVGVWEAPGNQGLLEVFDLVTKISNGQHDLLNPVGINTIRSYPGQGIRVMGVRTLSNLTDGRQYVNVRRLLNFVKVSVAEGLRQFIFRGIQPSLFDEIRTLVRSFFKSIWREGGLFPNNDFDEAQFVKVDGENNPLETRKQGRLFVDTGINPPLPAEFIIFRIGIFDGGSSVSESTS